MHEALGPALRPPTENRGQIDVWRLDRQSPYSEMASPSVTVYSSLRKFYVIIVTLAYRCSDYPVQGRPKMHALPKVSPHSSLKDSLEPFSSLPDRLKADSEVLQVQ